MKKPRSILWTALVLFLLVLVTIPVAGQGGWVERVSGEMSDSLNTPGLRVRLDATLNADGSVSGRGHYNNPAGGTYGLKVTEFCTGTVPSTPLDPEFRPYPGHQYAVAMGPAFGKDVVKGEWGAIVVVEGGATKPDAVWTAFVAPSSFIKYRYIDCSEFPILTNNSSVFAFPHHVV